VNNNDLKGAYSSLREKLRSYVVSENKEDTALLKREIFTATSDGEGSNNDSARMISGKEDSIYQNELESLISESLETSKSPETVFTILKTSNEQLINKNDSDKMREDSENSTDKRVKRFSTSKGSLKEIVVLKSLFRVSGHEIGKDNNRNLTLYRAFYLEEQEYSYILIEDKCKEFTSYEVKKKD